MKLEFLPETLDVQPLPEIDGFRSGVHVFDGDSILAVNAALAAQRPLLLRGEPGGGKTQLARAAAAALGRRFRSFTVDALTESRDLLWRVDSVARLGAAQVLGALKDCHSPEEVKVRLEENLFLHPGPLWFGFSWGDACRQAKLPKDDENGEDQHAAPRGVVVLIDEIDKADSSIPNGLLEALGSGFFRLPGGAKVKSQGAPLVILTTNEERTLPDAFLRRCLVHHVDLPKDDVKLQSWLVRRAQAHHPKMDPKLLGRAAELIMEDRRALQRMRLSAPGLAEYLDLLRAVETLSRETGQDPAKLVNRLAGFVCKKHAEDPRR